MPNLNTATFTLTDMEESRSLGDRLDDQFLSVKDFGATGDGTTDDADAIQLAFDTLYGSAGSPQTEAGAPLTSKVLYFPAGNYKVTQPLVFNRSNGVTLIGAGSFQTRIFWSGAEVGGEGDTSDPGTPISSLIEAKDSHHMHIEGMTLDASGVQEMVLRLMRFGSSPAHSSGTDGYYCDVHFTNAADSGVLGWGDVFGSERTYVSCKFTNCKYGVRLVQANALNHSWFNCYFGGNETGYSQLTGGCGVMIGCHFHDNSVVSVHHQQASLAILNCHSTDKNFASIGGTIIACRHTHADEGFFWTASISVIPGDSSPWETGVDHDTATCLGNYSSNGIFIANSSPDVDLMGNTFDNPDYLDSVDAGANFWEDSVDLAL